MSVNVYWDVSSEINSSDRKQLTVVQQNTDDNLDEFVTIATADKELTVYYIAKDIITAITDSSFILTSYGRAVLYGILSHLYLGVEIEKSMIFQAKYEDMIRQSKKDVNFAGVYSGQTMTEYSM